MLRTIMALGAISAIAAPALAQEEPGSVYYQISNCASYQLPGEPVWETACLAHDDWSVFFHASEHGSAMAYAYNGSERTEFYTPPRSLLFGGYHTTMEWRRTSEGAFATIHRYVSEGPSMDATPDGGPDSALGERQDHLVVTALKPDSYERVACPIYVVDASQIADANEAARIEQLTKQLGKRVLVSSTVASFISCPTEEMGAYELQGTGVSVKLFAPDFAETCHRIELMRAG